MATTPRGDDMGLRRAVLTNLARGVAQQRVGRNARPAPLRYKRNATATPTPGYSRLGGSGFKRIGNYTPLPNRGSMRLW